MKLHPGRCAALIVTLILFSISPPVDAQVDGDRVIETYAGNFNSDGFLATEAPLWPRGGILVEPDGNIILGDYVEAQRINMATGTVSRVAGIRSVSSSGDGGPAIAAAFASLGSWARDSQGNIYITDSFVSKIRKISTDGTINTVAGTGVFGYAGDGGAATSALLSTLYGVAVNASDELFIADLSNDRIRKVDSLGIITTVVGTGVCGFSGDGGPATAAEICSPYDVTFDAAGNLYFTDGSNFVVRKVDTSGTISTVAGTPGSFGYSGDGGPATSAELSIPVPLTIDSQGTLYIGDFLNYVVRRVDTAGNIFTEAGNGVDGFSGDGGAATAARMSDSWGLAVDDLDRLLIADTGNRRLRIVDDGTISTIAGTGNNFFGEGVNAIVAAISPRGMDFDGAGNLIVADGTTNERVRSIDANGIVTTIAGSGAEGDSGDGGPALLAEFGDVNDVSVDGSLIYVTDRDNHRIRVLIGGNVFAFAGDGSLGFFGDGGPAADAHMQSPSSTAVGVNGTVYIADTGNQRIRLVVTGDVSIISTFAGNGIPGSGGDGGPATLANLSSPRGVTVDSDENVYIADSGNGSVRKVDTVGIITTIISGLDFPTAVEAAPDDTILVSEDNRVIRIDQTGTLLEVVTGNGTAGFSGDGGLAIDGTTSLVASAVEDAGGNVFIAEGGNARIRRVFTFTAPPPQVPLPTVSEEAPGIASNSLTGSSVAGLGDINDDGFADVFAGAPGFQDDGGPVAAGAAVVYLGSENQSDRESADIIFSDMTTAMPHDRVGASVAGNFDFNGDGILDFLIGAEQVDRTDPDNPMVVGAGKVYLIYFDPTDMVHYPFLANPLVADEVDLSLVGQPGPTGIPGVVFLGDQVGDQAGFAIAGGGQVNPGLGQDIAIGAPGRDTPGGAGAGTVYVVFDDPSLNGVVSLTRVANDMEDQIDGVVYEGEAEDDGLGFSVAFPGNVVEPAGDDIAMGAPRADPDLPLRAPEDDVGIAFVASGGDLSSGIVQICQVGVGTSGVQIQGDQPGEGLGTSVAGGGDNLANGQDDLLIGAPGYDTTAGSEEGRVVQFAGTASQGIVQICQVGVSGGVDGRMYEGTAAGDQLGTALAGLSDVTGDREDDIALGAPFADPNGLEDAGTIYVVESDTTGSFGGIVQVCQVGDTIPGRQLAGTQPFEQAGTAIAATGDINGDGTNDFAAGSPGTDLPGDPDTGSVALVLETTELAAGQSSEPVANAGPSQVLECESGQATALLDGSASTDIDDDIVSYVWIENEMEIATGEMANVTFDLGPPAHLVTLRVTDAADLFDTTEVSINVVDTEGPDIVCPANVEIHPADVSIHCTSNRQAPVVLLMATASDACGNGVTISNSHNDGGADASGSFPFGTTMVLFSAVDGLNNKKTCTTLVTVQTPLSIDCSERRGSGVTIRAK